MDRCRFIRTAGLGLATGSGALVDVAGAGAAIYLQSYSRDQEFEADTLGVGYNMIEAIDQSWKRVPEGTVGGYWGILNGDRELKFPLTGPVREWPDWHAGASVAFGVALLALLLGWRRRDNLSFARWIATRASVSASISSSS